MRTVFIHIRLSPHASHTEFTASVLQIFDCICVINLWVHLTVALPCVMGCLGSLQLGLPCSPLLSLCTLKTTEQMEARWCSQLPFKFKIAQIFSWNNLRNKILEDMCAWFIKKKNMEGENVKTTMTQVLFSTPTLFSLLQDIQSFWPSFVKLRKDFRARRTKFSYAMHSHCSDWKVDFACCGQSELLEVVIARVSIAAKKHQGLK